MSVYSKEFGEARKRVLMTKMQETPVSDHEQAFWGNCANTFGEELKQMKYAELMRLLRFGDGRSPFNFWGYGLSWVDFGGGPSSMLLKMKGSKGRTVIDPLHVVSWVRQRYSVAGVELFEMPADGDIRWQPRQRDIGLCYNVMQHVENAARFAWNMRVCSQVQVVFEWVNLPPHEGHPTMLTVPMLQELFQQDGFTGELKGENECWGEFWCKPLRSDELAELNATPLTEETLKEFSFPNG